MLQGLLDNLRIIIFFFDTTIRFYYLGPRSSASELKMNVNCGLKVSRKDFLKKILNSLYF